MAFFTVQSCQTSVEVDSDWTTRRRSNLVPSGSNTTLDQGGEGELQGHPGPSAASPPGGFHCRLINPDFASMCLSGSQSETEDVSPVCSSISGSLLLTEGRKHRCALRHTHTHTHEAQSGAVIAPCVSRRARRCTRGCKCAPDSVVASAKVCHSRGLGCKRRRRTSWRPALTLTRRSSSSSAHGGVALRWRLIRRRGSFTERRSGFTLLLVQIRLVVSSSSHFVFLASTELYCF